MPPNQLNGKAWLLAVLLLGGCVHKPMDAAPDPDSSPAKVAPMQLPQMSPYDDDEDDDEPVVISI